MKIGILTQYYPPEVGAPQARLSELAQRCAAAGDDVFVLTSMPSYPRGRIFEGYGGLWRRTASGRITVLRTWAYPTRSLRFVPRLWNYFSFVLSSIVFGIFFLPRLDCLLTESPPLFLGISGWILSRICRARWIFNVSDLWPESAVRLGFVREGIALRAAEALESFCYRHAWLITGQSNDILHSISTRYPLKAVHHLSNGVDTAVFRPTSGSADSSPNDRSGRDCVAMYAGLHGAAQGLGQILDAAARLITEKHLRFVLVGDGPEKEALMREAAQRQLHNVTFLEARSHSEMPGLLARADIAVIPLRTALPGAVPSKIYEAMAVGLPIVLAAEGEAASIVENAQCGFAVPPGDSAALANAVRMLARDGQLRRQMAGAGRRAACRQFDRSGIVARFRARLEQELKHSSSTPARTFVNIIENAFERAISAAALVVLMPILALIALAIVLEDGFPVFFRQERVGRFGITFQIVKFRSMRLDVPGRAITISGDARITRVGRQLRRYKLDEIPQLWNVLRGDMSLVGPRPEVPRYVDPKQPEWQAVLRARPGITCVSSVMYRNEESLLAAASDPETYYRQTLLPRKLRLSAQYMQRRTPLTDLKLILATVWSAIRPHQKAVEIEELWL